MAIPPSTMNSFLHALRSEIDAVLNRDYNAAADFAESARLYGQILAIHPELRERMRARYPDLDAEQAVETIPKILECLASDGQQVHHNGSLLGTDHRHAESRESRQRFKTA